ncbi:SDR family NAD(P)-dependent oxidoreductase [Nocardia sp. CDC160]|uniref:SDR family NAD(P)-dependent oxidoreductase n=1 Tax=Nocardia sp. CDC160 TaxID=3112166 RepID=UPI002DBD4B7C|nr:SDR family NAD(P)-dependent oxidoreductase [Nocardia sp. CDC160]MEC3914554.1 SDR family NAD(P)-dependent oxidoreductase [Nocardia sp. CDC160]
MTRTVVISGGTDGMGRAFALARLARGDTVFAIGSSADKGEALTSAAGAAADRLRFLRADLSSIAETERVIGEIGARTEAIDALVLFANRVTPHRIQTADGLERTFALYYLSRYLLAHRLTPLLARGTEPVIVSVSGVGVTKGEIQWADPQLVEGYGAVRAQLQAGRANDLLGVDYAERFGETVRFVHYHPGFTRSGDLSALNPVARTLIRVLARFCARPVGESIAPIHDFVDHPPARPLTAIDRGRELPLTLPTLDPGNARRLAALTEELLAIRSIG